MTMTATLNAPGTVVNVEAGWFDSVDIQLGVIDSAAYLAFTAGQCHALAYAMHRATGWGMVQVGCDRDSDGVPGHWMVEMPDGQYLDILGAHSGEDVESEWGDIQGGDEDDLFDLVDRGEYRKPNLDAAEAFVQPVLDAYVNRTDRLTLSYS